MVEKGAKVTQVFWLKARPIKDSRNRCNCRRWIHALVVFRSGLSVAHLTVDLSQHD